jgi:hypothetical protein
MTNSRIAVAASGVINYFLNCVHGYYTPPGLCLFVTMSAYVCYRNNTFPIFAYTAYTAYEFLPILPILPMSDYLHQPTST